MSRQLMVLVVAALAVTRSGMAAPQKMDITNQINEKLKEILDPLPDPVVLNDPLVLKVDEEMVAHIYLQMDKCRLSGIHNVRAHDSFVTPLISKSTNFSISVNTPKLTINTNHYFINGSMVDHVELYGQGPGMISIDDMDVKIEGSGVVQILPSLSIQFDSATLDLEMKRWTVNLEDLMPDTDLGTVFNEFFSMAGPEIFDTVERNINNSGKLLDFLNSLFSRP